MTQKEILLFFCASFSDNLANIDSNAKRALTYSGKIWRVEAKRYL